MIDLMIFPGKHDDFHGYHPTLFHMIDAGCVSREILTMNPSITESIRDELGLASIEDTIRVVSFLVALHDIGKLSPHFVLGKDIFRSYVHGKIDESDDEFPYVESVGLVFHNWVSCVSVLKGEVLTHLKRCPRDDIAKIYEMHHGYTSESSDKAPVDGIDKVESDRGRWKEVRQDACQVLLRVFGLQNDDVDFKNHFFSPRLFVLLSGLLCVSDWVSSTYDAMPYDQKDRTPDDYYLHSQQKAKDAIARLGLDSRSVSVPNSFGDLFKDSAGNDLTPNATQSLCGELAASTDSQFMLIIEDMTGGGKTNAALWAHFKSGRYNKTRGYYHALPTQATSNQMFSRMTEYTRAACSGGNANPQLQLAHGAWFLDENFYDSMTDDLGSASSQVSSHRWFGGNKKSLLTQFAVGTVDQAIMGVLYTGHFFVRLFGLYGKTVVMDEIHAYDAYTSRLIEWLVDWLVKMDCNIVLLSATLPTKTRRSFVGAFLGDGETVDEPPDTAAYPRVTFVDYDKRLVTEHHVAASDFKKVDLSWVKGKDVPDILADQMSDGGCCAWVCGTVSRSQEAYRILKADPRFSDCDLILFHSRTLTKLRSVTENDVIGQFDRSACTNGKRPRKSIVIATSVIEQSLDIDFDLMVSDIAPIDLLIQRMGRLHRFDGVSRPTKLASPKIYLVKPEFNEQGVPDFGWLPFHQPYILALSGLILRDRDSISTPGETDFLIESIYGDDNYKTEDLAGVFGCAYRNALDNWRTKLRENIENANKADKVRVRSVAEKNEPSMRYLSDVASDDEFAITMTKTRLGIPTLSLVLLYQQNGFVSLDRDGLQPINPRVTPPSGKKRIEWERSLRDNAASVFLPGSMDSLREMLAVDKYDIGGPGDDNKKSVRSLRRHRIVTLKKAEGVGESDQFLIEGYFVSLDDVLGVKVGKVS